MTLERTFVPLTVEGAAGAGGRTRRPTAGASCRCSRVNTEDGIDLVYSFMKDGVLDEPRDQGVKKGTSVPSITDRFLEAFVFENETHDLFGVDIRASPSTSAATSTRWRRRSP